MKKTILFTALMLANLTLFAQSYSELRPSWARTTPNPPAGANYFLSWGVGEGNTETEACNAAWADALQKSLHELGVVGITQQDIDAVKTKGIDGVISFNKMKRRSLCQTEFIRKPNSYGGKIYLLIQVQRSVHGNDDFYSVNTAVCNDADFNRMLAAYNSRQTGDYGTSLHGGRVFVPGMAQIYKGSTGKGVFFIAGEVVFVGGIVIAESLRASCESKINTTHNAATKQDYIDKADTYGNIRNAAIAGTVALYAWNVIDGMVAKGKRQLMIGNSQLRISPCFTPEASGIYLSINF
jgi:hypothetical protein